jgi:hypothetical protein
VSSDHSVSLARKALGPALVLVFLLVVPSNVLWFVAIAFLAAAIAGGLAGIVSISFAFVLAIIVRYNTDSDFGRFQDSDGKSDVAIFAFLVIFTVVAAIFGALAGRILEFQMSLRQERRQERR